MALLQSIEDKQFAANIKMLREQNEELTKEIGELRKQITELTSAVIELTKSVDQY